MCRRYSRGSKDIRGFGQDVRAEEGRERLGGHQFHWVLQGLQEIGEREEAIE
jgi:hypothetical protein